jgi:hypothetical protein
MFSIMLQAFFSYVLFLVGIVDTSKYRRQTIKASTQKGNMAPFISLSLVSLDMLAEFVQIYIMYEL